MDYIKKWFLPISNPNSKNPFLQGISMSSEKEFLQLCQNESFDFFLNSSIPYNTINKGTSYENMVNSDPLVNYLFFKNSLKSLIIFQEYNFLKIITKQYESDIMAIENSVQEFSTINQDLFNKNQARFLESCSDIIQLETALDLSDVCIFNFSEWIYDKATKLSNITYKNSEGNLSEIFKEYFNSFEPDIQGKILTSLVKSSKTKNFHNTTGLATILSSSNEEVNLAQLFKQCLHHLNIDNNNIHTLEKRLSIYPLWEYLSLNPNNNTLEAIYPLYYKNVDSLFQKGHENYNFLGKVKNIYFTESSPKILPLLNEIESKRLRELLFEPSKVHPEVNNFQIIMGDSPQEQYQSFFHHPQMFPIGEKVFLDSFELFKINPHGEGTIESLLWKDSVLAQTLFSAQINDKYSYVFESCWQEFGTFSFFNNIQNFLDDAIEFSPQSLQSLNPHSIQTLLDFCFNKFESFRDDDKFIELIKSTLKLAHHYNIDIEIPEYQNRYPNDNKTFIIIENLYLELHTVKKQPKGSAIKF